jgi:hypothetical protein
MDLRAKLSGRIHVNDIILLKLHYVYGKTQVIITAGNGFYAIFAPDIIERK